MITGKAPLWRSHPNPATQSKPIGAFTGVAVGVLDVDVGPGIEESGGNLGVLVSQGGMERRPPGTLSPQRKVCAAWNESGD